MQIPGDLWQRLARQGTALALILLYTGRIQAQNPLLPPCGTPAYIDEWVTHYKKHKPDYRVPEDEILYLPLKIHLIGSDEGNGFYSYQKLMRALCALNEDFSDSKIQFFLFGDIDYIYNTAWNNHKSVLEGAEMMFANNDPKAINCYIGTSAAGNCGYNLPYAGVVIAKACITGHTWTHELGHNLSLQHPFLGWEGKQYKYSNPTPRFVTYDYTNFKDSLITDTTIIDTAFVELVDGSNCQNAADKICDSPPDYLSFRWNCNNSGKSTILQKDYNNQDFYSDGSLYMSYSSDECQTRFTTAQMELMRATISYKKTFLLDVPTPQIVHVPDVSALDYPAMGEVLPVDHIQLEWKASEHASRYIVQVSLNKSFSRIKYQGPSDTNHLALKLKIPRKYYWRVYAYGRSDYCSGASPTGYFSATEAVGVKQKDSAPLSFYVFQERPGETMLSISSGGYRQLQLEQYNINGARVKAASVITVHKGLYQYRLTNTPGLHLLIVRDEQSRKLYHKLFVVN